jgi:hypothetical protein
MDENGAIAGTGQFALSGQEALFWRQLALLEDSVELAKDFADFLGATLPDGVSGKLDKFDGLTDYESDLVANIKLSGNLGSTTGKRLIVPGLLFEARGKHPFVDEESRQVPVDLHYATMEQDEVTYHLPPGLNPSTLPRDPNVEWTGRLGLSIGSTLSGNALTVKRKFVCTATLIDPSLYSTLRYVYRQISAADQQQIVLDRSTSAAN